MSQMKSSWFLVSYFLCILVLNCNFMVFGQKKKKKKVNLLHIYKVFSLKTHVQSIKTLHSSPHLIHLSLSSERRHPTGEIDG